MRIAYFPNSVALNGGAVLESFLASCRDRGIEIKEGDLDADAAVIWSVLWNGRMANNQAVWKHYRDQNKPVIVIDVGTLIRGHTWKIALNSITAQGYYGHTINLDNDRPRRLGITLGTNHSKNPSIIIAGQHRRSLQVSEIGSLEHWIVEKIKQVREHTDRPIVIRPHPRDRLNFRSLPPDTTVQQPNKLPNTYDSYDLEFDCHAVINYNSGPGVLAGLSGTRPIVDSTSLAHPVSIEMKQIEQPYAVDRNQWLIEICHTEYTQEEIKQGQWIQRLQAGLPL